MWIFWKKDQEDKQIHFFFTARLLIFTKGANISRGHCTSPLHSPVQNIHQGWDQFTFSIEFDSLPEFKPEMTTTCTVLPFIAHLTHCSNKATKTNTNICILSLLTKTKLICKRRQRKYCISFPLSGLDERMVVEPNQEVCLDVQTWCPNSYTT